MEQRLQELSLNLGKQFKQMEMASQATLENQQKRWQELEVAMGQIKSLFEVANKQVGKLQPKV